MGVDITTITIGIIGSIIGTAIYEFWIKNQVISIYNICVDRNKKAKGARDSLIQKLSMDSEARHDYRFAMQLYYYWAIIWCLLGASLMIVVSLPHGLPQNFNISDMVMLVMSIFAFMRFLAVLIKAAMMYNVYAKALGSMSASK